jgi:F-type H+-transporting ATPase subunit epsilon
LGHAVAAFHFELVSPEKLVFSGDVEAVVVPGTEGEFTVLKHHAPLISTMKPGIVVIDETPAKKLRLFVRGGFAEVAPSSLTILAEKTIPLADLDAAGLDAELKNFEDEVAGAKTDETRRMAVEKRDQLLELRAALKI